MKKTGFASQSRFSSNAVGSLRSLLAVLLDAGGAQAGQAMLVDGKLPGQEFVDRQRVAAAGLLEREQPTADRGRAQNSPAYRCTMAEGRMLHTVARAYHPYLDLSTLDLTLGRRKTHFTPWARTLLLIWKGKYGSGLTWSGYPLQVGKKTQISGESTWCPMI